MFCLWTIDLSKPAGDDENHDPAGADDSASENDLGGTGSPTTGAGAPKPVVSADAVREGVLAIEGSVIADLTLPLPGDLKDLSKAASLISGIVEDRIPEMLNSVRSTTWDEGGTLGAFEFRRFTR